jgi:hypothetical protein
VVCPISVLGVWPDQIHKHTPKGFGLEWLTVNYESTYDRDYHGRSWTPVPAAELLDYDADLLIVDEAHNLGNPQAVSSRMVYELSRRARFRLVMTGTMFHRKPFYVFGQAKLYDPSVFGTSFTAFKRMIAVFGGYGGYEVLRYQNLDWMMDRIEPWCWIEEDVPPNQPPVINEIRFDLTGQGLMNYVAMDTDSILQVGKDKVVSPIVLSRHLRCQQIAGGWIRTEDGRYVRVGQDLLRTGLDRIREYAEQDIRKVVVGCRFRPEMNDVARAAERAGFVPVLHHGGIRKETRPALINHWRESRKPSMLIAQMQTLKEGVDLSAADTMLLWSLSESYVTHEQFTSRIKLYDDDRTLMYDYLIPEGTRTEVTYEALGEKQDVARYMATDPQRVERITSKLRETP